MVEIIKIMEASELPINTQNEIKVFKGLVEVRIKKDSPPVVESIKGVKGTFADILFEALTIGGKEK